jgi:molybdenum cofactor cytidylyltransferase
VGLVATRVAGTGERILDKTAAVLEERLAALGSELVREIRCTHDADAVGAAVGELAGQGLDPIVVFGASATIDRRDMVPAGIEAAGGTVSHVGMPVDPGNLLVLAARGETRVIGAPGCARSPAENGFDWVLRRLLAGLAVTPEDITAMGVGGLLKEIKTRPQPRQGPGEKETSPGRGPIAALVLAAGQSRRMGGVHKLLEPLGGKPLVRRAAEAALASKADKVVVVTGHRGEDVRAALQGLEVEFVDNPDFAEGLSTSLRAGVAALGATTAGVVVCLGDMPDVGPELIDRLIAAFDPAAGRLIAVSAHEGKRGNPVLFAMRFRDELMAVQGDVGARHLIGAHEEAVVEVEAGKAALVDVDTPDALAAARAALGEGERGS